MVAIDFSVIIMFDGPVVVDTTDHVLFLETLLFFFFVHLASGHLSFMALVPLQ